MKTTELFVEILVIGFGCALWITLAWACVIDVSILNVSDKLLVPLLLPALSVIYVLGIVWDKLSDAIFEVLLFKKHKVVVFGSDEACYQARRIILTRSERLSDLLEYGRSRLRICRGWVLSALLATVFGNILIFQHAETQSLALYGLASAFGIFLTLGCYYTVKKLMVNEYRKIKEQAEFLCEQPD